MVGEEGMEEIEEENIRGESLDEEMVMEKIEKCFIEKDGKRKDIVVIECKNYKFIVNVLRSMDKWKVDWMEKEEEIERRMK